MPAPPSVAAKALSTAAYTWDPERKRYLTPSGRVVPPERVAVVLDRVAARAGQRLTDTTARLQRGEITLITWQHLMAKQIKALHVASAAVQLGGPANMSARDWGRVGAAVKKQYRYLAGFASDVATGKTPLDGRVVARAGLYAAAARGTRIAVERHKLIRERRLAGEKWILGRAEHCTGCLAQSKLGWQEVGVLPPIGSQECRTRCKCSIKYGYVVAGAADPPEPPASASALPIPPARDAEEWYKEDIVETAVKESDGSITTKKYRVLMRDKVGDLRLRPVSALRAGEEIWRRPTKVRLVEEAPVGSAPARAGDHGPRPAPPPPPPKFKVTDKGAPVIFEVDGKPVRGRVVRGPDKVGDITVKPSEPLPAGSKMPASGTFYRREHKLTLDMPATAATTPTPAGTAPVAVAHPAAPTAVDPIIRVGDLVERHYPEGTTRYRVVELLPGDKARIVVEGKLPHGLTADRFGDIIRPLTVMSKVGVSPSTTPPPPRVTVAPAPPRATPPPAPPKTGVTPATIAAHRDPGSFPTLAHKHATDTQNTRGLDRQLNASLDTFVRLAQTVLGSHVNRANLRDELTKLAKKQLAGAQVSSRVPRSVLKTILKDGKFKTQFETGTSRGALSPRYRAEAEEKGLNYPHSTNKAFRPYYGYAHKGDDEQPHSVEHYGDIEVRFKKDINTRTTIMMTDTLGPMSMGEHSGWAVVPLADPDYRLMTAETYSFESAIKTTSLNRVAGVYPEVQVHGGLFVDDVEEVIYWSGDPDQETKDLLAAKGITWRRSKHWR